MKGRKSMLGEKWGNGTNANGNGMKRWKNGNGSEEKSLEND